ncbi:hypothetical protein VTJ04DRAFT_4455 [Mycothermus thermophilus]|uniref:uncharacterized protein n=1 Tax=Humicola insolens TaxID=85995 RepID=UPI003743FB06
MHVQYSSMTTRPLAQRSLIHTPTLTKAQVTNPPPINVSQMFARQHYPVQSPFSSVVLTNNTSFSPLFSDKQASKYAFA